MINFEIRNDKFRTALNRFEKRESIHLRFAELEEEIPEINSFFESHFAQALKTAHPLGISKKATLWVSASGSVYARHIDVLDGLLIQLHGRKEVTLYERPADYLERIIIDHDYSELDRPAPSVTHELTLESGQAVFIPRGTPHRVRILEGEQSVAISMHAGGLYPVIGLVKEINAAIRDATAFGLPFHALRLAKENIRFFDPSAAFFSQAPSTQAMPQALRGELLSLLKARSDEWAQRLPDLLNEWWRDLLVRRDHCRNGLYPKVPLPPERESHSF